MVEIIPIPVCAGPCGGEIHGETDGLSGCQRGGNGRADGRGDAGFSSQFPFRNDRSSCCDLQRPFGHHGGFCKAEQEFPRPGTGGQAHPQLFPGRELEEMVAEKVPRRQEQLRIKGHFPERQFPAWRQGPGLHRGSSGEKDRALFAHLEETGEDPQFRLTIFLLVETALDIEAVDAFREGELFRPDPVEFPVIGAFRAPVFIMSFCVRALSLST